MTTEGKETAASRVYDYLTAELLLTSDCNLACSYCIARDLPKATLSIEEGKKAIDLFIRLGEGASSIEFTLTGGEPLLKFPLVKNLVCYAEKRAQSAGMDVGFVLKTNGTILNQAIIDFVCAHRLKVVISIDGIPNVHDRHRFTKKHRPTYSIVLHNLLVLLENDIQCVASITIHPDACATLSNSVRQLHEMGIDRIDVGPAYGTVKWSDSDISTMVDAITEIGRYIRNMRSAGDELEVGPLYHFSEHVGGILKDSWGCHAASTNLAFMPNGQIAGCSSLAMIATRYPELIIGDIATGMNKAALGRFLELAQAGIQQRSYCQRCETAPNCAGGCLAINLSQNGSYFSPPCFYCRTISIIPKAWGYAWNDIMPSDDGFKIRSIDHKAFSRG